MSYALSRDQHAHGYSYIKDADALKLLLDLDVVHSTRHPISHDEAQAGPW